MLAIADVLETLRSDVAAHTNGDVFLGAPDTASPGIYIFPFQFRMDQLKRNLPFKKAVGLPGSYPVVVRCLMMTSPASEFSMLDGGLECLLGRPVVHTEEGTVFITISEISMDELGPVFISAGIGLRLAVAFEVRVNIEG